MGRLITFPQNRCYKRTLELQQMDEQERGRIIRHTVTIIKLIRSNKVEISEREAKNEKEQNLKIYQVINEQEIRMIINNQLRKAVLDQLFELDQASSPININNAPSQRSQEAKNVDSAYYGKRI